MVDSITTTVIALLGVPVNITMNPSSRLLREREGDHLPIMHPITLWLHTGRDSHHHHWEPIAKGTEVPYLDVTRAEVIHHFQVPDHKEEHHSLHQHPEEAGQEKVVQEACNDGTAHLERRSMHIQDHFTLPPPPKKQIQTTVGVHFDWSSPITAHSSTNLYRDILPCRCYHPFGWGTHCPGLPGTSFSQDMRLSVLKLGEF